jgi:hypothetical protein
VEKSELKRVIGRNELRVGGREWAEESGRKRVGGREWVEESGCTRGWKVRDKVRLRAMLGRGELCSNNDAPNNANHRVWSGSKRVRTRVPSCVHVMCEGPTKVCT